jgi:exodeoxyribonuclease V alpha subunit
VNSGEPLQTLEGTIERLTFQNEENGYTVARLLPKGLRDTVTVVGNLAGVTAGEVVILHGVWLLHKEYGRQFEVRSFQTQYPATLEGLRKYLGSGLIKGVGPVTARRIVDAFGLKTLDIIETKIDRLLEVPGIGAYRVGLIERAWEDQKQIKEIMLFLQSHGVSASLAVKIYKKYLNQSIQVVQNEPYRLAKDIFGIGFKTADKIALALGLPHDSGQRIQAGLQFVLGLLSDEGHCFATRAQLVEKAVEILAVPAEDCQREIEILVAREDLIAEDQAIYLPPFYYAELGVARKLRQMSGTALDRLSVFQNLNWETAYTWLAERSTLQLAASQKEAIRMALTERVSILTGGPGTGKSTIIGSLIDLLKAKSGSVLLAAPTGRAAKRLSETTGLEAKTIHRLLEYNPAELTPFARDKENPLDADMIIVDESSMIDILLMNHLLKAVENGSHLLVVGDVDQLPSVGAGNVLKDMIASGVLPVTRLTTIFRQSAESAIISNAHRINRGEFPQTGSMIKDFFLFKEDDPQKAAELILDLMVRRISSKFGYNAQEDIQLLSPMHRGPVGVSALNEQLQAGLNPPSALKKEYTHGHRVIREGDRVMQIRNNYDKNVFNGDMGRVEGIDLEEQIVVVDFEGVQVSYEFHELDELMHAYAVSIHKSQGSEFPVVVIPLLTQHYMMLQRNLLYTGVTRARKMVVLVGSAKAVAMAVRNNRISERNTRLAERLKVEPLIDKRYQV